MSHFAIQLIIWSQGKHCKTGKSLGIVRENEKIKIMAVLLMGLSARCSSHAVCSVMVQQFVELLTKAKGGEHSTYYQLYRS